MAFPVQKETIDQKIHFKDKRGRSVELDRASGYLMLSAGTVQEPTIKGLRVPNSCTIGGTEFVAKDELHISLVGRDIGKAAFGKKQINLDDRLQELLSRYSFEFTLSSEGLKIITSGEKKSIIAHVVWPEAIIFYSELSARFLDSARIIMPPHHITLMISAGDKKGIGVPTWQRLSELSPVRVQTLS